MGGYYPDGVTGNEYAISGPEYEREEGRSCHATNVTIRVISAQGEEYLSAALTQVKGGGGRKLGKNLDLALREIEDVELDECSFDGDVLVTGHSGVLWWTCPLCRTQHDEEPEGWDG